MTETTTGKQATPLAVGEEAPEFALSSTPDQRLALSQEGTSERALYVIDANGVIRWNYVSPVGVNPGADGILRALESLGQDERS